MENVVFDSQLEGSGFWTPMSAIDNLKQEAQL